MSVRWEPICSMRTDERRDIPQEANSRFTQLLCERTLKDLQISNVLETENRWFKKQRCDGSQEQICHSCNLQTH